MILEKALKLKDVSTVIIDHDLSFIDEYAKISNRNSEGFECYVGLTNKYVCSSNAGCMCVVYFR